MGNFGNSVYFGDEIDSINEVCNRGYISEELEIIGANYANKYLVIVLKRPSGKGLNFEFEGEKIIKHFCWDLGIYHLSGYIDFQKLKGKKVRGFIRKPKNNSKNSGKDYIGAISSIDGNHEIISKICGKEYQKVLEKLENSGNNSLENCVDKRFSDRFGSSYFGLDNFNYWNLN